MQPFEPHALPLTDLDWRQLLPLVGRANAALARYDGLLAGIPNPAVMLSPLTTQEAVLSSKIEGTQATVDEVLEQEAGLLKEGEKFEDIQEISNYRKALYQAREYLKDYPIRLGFVRELHRTLMSSVRGQDKTPGEFRLDQNWIGKMGCTMKPGRAGCGCLLAVHIHASKMVLERSKGAVGRGFEAPVPASIRE